MTDYLSPAVRQAAANLARHQQFTDLLQAVNDNMKTASQTGIQLGRDFVLVRKNHNLGLITWEGCGKFSEYESDCSFRTQSEAVENACAELGGLNLPDLEYTPLISRDFTVYEIPGHGYHWESCGRVFGTEYCSEDGFENQVDAVNDAISFLTSIEGEGDHEIDFSNLEA